MNGPNKEAIEEEHLDVMQNLEFAVARLYPQSGTDGLRGAPHL